VSTAASLDRGRDTPALSLTWVKLPPMYSVVDDTAMALTRPSGWAQWEVGTATTEALAIVAVLTTSADEAMTAKNALARMKAPSFEATPRS